jgi:hypothetical protein
VRVRSERYRCVEMYLISNKQYRDRVRSGDTTYHCKLTPIIDLRRCQRLDTTSSDEGQHKTEREANLMRAINVMYSS